MNSITDLMRSENEYYDNQKATGFVQGTVVENNNPDFKGMVKVEFTVWETGKNMCEWVRLMAPAAGPGYGWYWVPEIDETVLVGFIGGSLKRPFLLGSLYPGGAAMVSESFDENNRKKHLRTKGGVDLLLTDEDQKQTIKLTTPKGTVVLVDDENEIVSVADKDAGNTIRMDCKKGETTILSKSKLLLKAGEKTQLQMDGSSGEISLKASKVAVSADNEIGLKATAALKAEGAQVKISGQSQVDVQSSGPLSAKGAVVKIN
ncbi:MAG: phage baseplate assembly protein V [Eubacteriales bacterium]|nr:phage baseplate assembly protein V [Eubacteriales bacterium]